MARQFIIAALVLVSPLGAGCGGHSSSPCAALHAKWRATSGYAAANKVAAKAAAQGCIVGSGMNAHWTTP